MFYFSKQKTVRSEKERTTFRFYLNFITLTLPSQQIHTDDYIKDKMLVPFLEWLCRTKGAKMWLWKAESQREGNIHFHITSHIFVHWKVVRFKWNQICNKHGYAKVFQDGSTDGGKSATQVKAAKNAEQIGGYLANYISKKDTVKIKIKKPKGLPNIESPKGKCSTIPPYYGMNSVLKRPVNGRLWACSTNLSKIDCSFLGEDYAMEINDIADDVISLGGERKDEKYYTLLLYRHLKYHALPTYIKFRLDEIGKEMNLNEETKVVVQSLFD